MQISNLKQLTSLVASYCGLSEAVESNDVKTAIDQLSAGTTTIDDYLSYRYFDETDGLFIGDGVVGFMLDVHKVYYISINQIVFIFNPFFCKLSLLPQPTLAWI